MSGGSKVFSTDSADTSTRPTVEADGVPTQVVGQGFDLGQFGHESSVPVRRGDCAEVSRTISDNAQLTIDSTIAAQIAVHQKSSM